MFDFAGQAMSQDLVSSSSADRKKLDATINTEVDALAGRIKTAIQASGRTMKNVAEQSGIAYNSLSGYANGHRAPDSLVLARLADICDANPAWLLTGTGPMHRIEPPPQPPAPGRVHESAGSYETRTHRTLLEISDGSRIIARMGIWMEAGAALSLTVQQPND